MLFTETPKLRALERLMTSVPNFMPRGSGCMVLHCFEPPPEPCPEGCRTYCGKGVKCRAPHCPYLEAHIIAGRASRAEVMKETMKHIRSHAFLRRLCSFLRESEDHPMHFRNEKHRLVFNEAMEDFYKLCEEEYYSYDKQRKYLYTEETLQDVCLGIHSMCMGAESKYFNGHTNITDSRFLVFGVKGLMDTNKRLKDAMLFNILSFMSNQLLGAGNTAASIDELYLFLTNMTAIEYIRNAMKRVRKKDSSIILASQNIEDFLIPSIRELTKPLFSIPTHPVRFAKSCECDLRF